MIDRSGSLFRFPVTLFGPPFLACMLVSCGIPYSIAWKYPDLVGRTVRLKEDRVICSTEGRNFAVSGYLMLTPRQASGLKITPIAEVSASETFEVIDIICVADKAGKRCYFVCAYETQRTRYRFYLGAGQERNLTDVANRPWEYVSPALRDKE